jgi:thiamine biosynthesis lipoprotein
VTSIVAGVVVHVEDVMGTVVSFHLYPGRCPEPDARTAVGLACRRLHELDDLFSIWDPRSPMSRVRSGELEPGHAPAEVAEVIELCRQARDLSGGWFDPWAMPAGLDPTGLVKGWAVEAALEIVRHAGVEAAMVNAGGDIALLGQPPEGAWRVGIRHPWRFDALACVLEADAAVATSGCYERGRHLVDPKGTGGVEETASATVTGPSLAFADAFATALAVGGDDALDVIATLDGYEGYLIRADGSERTTAGIVLG